MDQDYIEKMAREYAELLRAHTIKTAQNITVPSTARTDYFALTQSQLRATAYLKSTVKIPVKKRLLLTIERELNAVLPTPYTAKKHAFAGAESAISSLVEKELEKLEKLDSFELGEQNTTKKYFVLTLISLLCY